MIVMDPYDPGELKKSGMFAGDDSNIDKPNAKPPIDRDIAMANSLTDAAHGLPRPVREDACVIGTLKPVQRSTEAGVAASTRVECSIVSNVDKVKAKRAKGMNGSRRTRTSVASSTTPKTCRDQVHEMV